MTLVASGLNVKCTWTILFFSHAVIEKCEALSSVLELIL